MPNWVANRVEIYGDKSEIDRFIEMGKGVDGNGDNAFIFSNYFHFIGLNDVDVMNNPKIHHSLVGCNSVGFSVRFEEKNNRLYFYTKNYLPHKFFYIFSVYFKLTFVLTSVEYNADFSYQTTFNYGLMSYHTKGTYSLFGNERVYKDDEKYNFTDFKDEIDDLVSN